MDAREESLSVLREIRSMMDGAGRFRSLSGKAGVYAGCYALAGWLGVHVWVGVSPLGVGLMERLTAAGEGDGLLWVFVGVGVVVLVAALSTGLWMAVRKAAGRGESLWDAAARQVLSGLMVPWVVGGLYILTLFYHGHRLQVLPASLLFYGLGLVGASRHTLAEVRGLGFAFLLTGLAAALQPGMAHWYWAFGFGLLHIGYGLWIHRRHER
jgi:hypothetical protein